MREGGLVGFGGGALEKNWLERGGQPKKNEGRGGVGRKNQIKNWIRDGSVVLSDPESVAI